MTATVYTDGDRIIGCRHDNSVWGDFDNAAGLSVDADADVRELAADPAIADEFRVPPSGGLYRADGDGWRRVGATLDTLKDERRAAVKLRTADLQRIGFHHAGHWFPITQTAIGAMSAVMIGAAHLSYPYGYPDRDGGTLQFAEPSELGLWYGAAMVAGTSILGGESSLLAAIDGATTFSELAAVVDERTE